MNHQNQIAEALSFADEKYISEYANFKKKSRINPAVLTSALAACLCLCMAIPLFFGKNEEHSAIDKVWPWGETLSETVTVGGLSVNSGSVIHDAHVNFNGVINDGNSLQPNGVIAFPETLYCHLYQNTNSLLVIKGKKFSSESYTCNLTENGMEKVLRFTVTAIKINEILKENNSSGYNKGDLIYIYETYVFEPAVDGSNEEYKITCGSLENDISVNEEAVYLLSIMQDREKKHNYWKVADALSKQDTWRINCVRSEDEYKEALELFKKNPDFFESLIK